jgi:hypothetical protein
LGVSGCRGAVRLCKALRSALGLPRMLVNVSLARGLRRVLREGNFGGAICEWASAPPRITLVTKSWGSLRVSSPAEDFPSTGVVTKICPFSLYTFLYSSYIGGTAKGYIGWFTPPRACYKLDGPQNGRESLQYGYAVHVEEDFYSVDEAARILKLTPGRIRQMLRAGELEGL